MTPSDLLVLNAAGRIVRGAGTPSAETVLHTVIYGDRPDASAILHVHTVWNTLIGLRFASAGQFRLTGYELLKALDGVTTHEHHEVVPVLANTQDYTELSVQLTEVLREHTEAHGVLLSAHGLYTWGKSVQEARRHLEALEFLFEVEGRRIFGV